MSITNLAKSSYRKNGKAVHIVGKSRSGKTALTQHLVLAAKYKRLAVWDFDGGWSTAFSLLKIDFEVVENAHYLVRAMKNDTSNKIICYKPETFSKDLEKEFQFFCGAVLLWIMQKPAAVIVEEAAAVLRSGQATGNWQTLQNQGQKYGGAVYCILQRPQEGDKTSMTQATDKYVFRVEEHEKKYIREKYGITESLVPDQNLLYIHIDAKGDTYKGALSFNGEPEQGANPKNFKLREHKIS